MKGHIGKHGDGCDGKLVTLQYDPDLVRSRPDMTSWFQSFGVDLMFYSRTQRLPFETGIPYVMAIHDLQHRLQPEFPEVSATVSGNRASIASATALAMPHCS